MTHYGEVAKRRDYTAEPVMHCRRWGCAHYGELDDGEDEAGNPYPPCPVCYSRGTIQGLGEDWMGPQNCIGVFEEREED